MIKYAYSYTGKYNLDDGRDWSKTIILDAKNQKMIAFGKIECKFQELSDEFLKEVEDAAADARLALSQRGAAKMYQSIYDDFLVITTRVSSIENKYGEIENTIERLTKVESDIKQLQQNDEDIADSFYSGALSLQDVFNSLTL